MKKNILKLTFALAVVVAAGYTVYASQASSEIAGVALDNVEAIASGESGNCTFGSVVKDQYSHTLHCSGSGTLCCEW